MPKTQTLFNHSTKKGTRLFLNYYYYKWSKPGITQHQKQPTLPARPGDGTDEFGDWTVLFEGGLGWP